MICLSLMLRSKVKKTLSAFLDCNADTITDYLKTAISLAIVAAKNLRKTIGILTPYIVLLVCFVGFVLWNGGVVLGML
jgi:hypothetical protein